MIYNLMVNSRDMCSHLQKEFNHNDTVHLWNKFDNSNIRKNPKFLNIQTYACEFKDGVPEKVILHDVNFNTSNTYILASSLLLPTIPHSIVGLKCNDDSYIYDSNNYIVYDDWDHNQYYSYVNLLKEKNVEYANSIEGLNFYNLIYIKE